MLTFQVLDAWIADICLSACFCSTKRFQFIWFCNQKFAESDKEVSGKMLASMQTKWDERKTKKQRNIEVAEKLYLESMFYNKSTSICK